jgi:hypothetical protein
MNAPEPHSRTLPRYGLREDEMTRPGVVLYDWDGDDEATVRFDAVEAAALADADLDADFDARLFRPHWRGIGRRPGTVALTVVLGVSVAIGICALLTPAEAQGTALSAR